MVAIWGPSRITPVPFDTTVVSDIPGPHLMGFLGPHMNSAHVHTAASAQLAEAPAVTFTDTPVGVWGWWLSRVQLVSNGDRLERQAAGM